MKIKRLEVNCKTRFPSTSPLIHLYIMTSSINDSETKEHFENHSYFGLNKEQVHFFCQDNIPIITYDGDLVQLPSITGEPTVPPQFITVPNGNGGVYEALLKSGSFDEMKKNGIKWVHFVGMDNIMVKPADPLLLGLCDTQNVQLGNRAVTKVFYHHRSVLLLTISFLMQYFKWLSSCSCIQKRKLVSFATKRVQDGKNMELQSTWK